MAPALFDVLQFFRGQLFQTPPMPTARFDGQTVVITGSNGGIGFESAKQILALGASTVILACRSVERGETAKQSILASAVSSRKVKADVQVWQLDMADYSSVRTFATRLSTLPRLDALILNAGVSTKEFHAIQGSESILVVNVIATFLLARLALPLLEQSAAANEKPGRLVITGSVAHAFADPKELTSAPPGQVFATLGDPKTARMDNRYLLSKLLVLMGVRRMANEIDPARVIINFAAPGWCKTELFRSEGGGGIGLRLIGRPAELGARCNTSAAIAGPETHGQYLSECRVKNMSVWMRSKEGKEVEGRIWEELVALLDGLAAEP